MRLVYFCSLDGSDMPQKVRKYLCQYLLDEYQDKHLGPSPSLDEDRATRKLKLEYRSQLERLYSSKVETHYTKYNVFRYEKHLFCN